MHKLPHSVLDYVGRHGLLRPGDRVGAAVSGGADSVALLRILLELRDELGIVLSVVHLNHRLRSRESDQDERFVRELAGAHGLAFIAESRDVKAYSRDHKLSLETAARRLRYEFFVSVLQKGSLDKIATAHSLDDQAETVLLKLTRGAGTRGVAGIYPRLNIQRSPSAGETAIAIVRPLLATRRSEIEAYLRELGQSWREDSSNLELRHMRNRVRRQILPALEKQVNPSVAHALAEAAEIARAEEEFWAEQVNQAFPRLWNGRDNGGYLDWTEFAKLGLALQRRLIRAAGEKLRINLEFRHVEAILRLSQENGRSVMIPGGWSVRLHPGQLEFRPDCPQPGDYSYPLPVPGRIEVPEAGIVVEAISVSENANQSSNAGALSVHGISELVIRNWRAGDRFWAPHTRAPKKIKDLLQRSHILGKEKRLWPVAASGDEIVWVKGFGTARDFHAANGEAPKGDGILIRDTPFLQTSAKDPS